jgi:hypothetical protein
LQGQNYVAHAHESCSTCSLIKLFVLFVPASLLQVTQHPNCTVRITVYAAKEAGDEFIVNGVAVVPYGKKSRTPVDELATLYQSKMT